MQTLFNTAILYNNCISDLPQSSYIQPAVSTTTGTVTVPPSTQTSTAPMSSFRYAGSGASTGPDIYCHKVVLLLTDARAPPAKSIIQGT